MNTQLVEFARQSLLEGLAQVTPDMQKKFKWMYGMKNGTRNLAEAESLTIEEVVAEMPEEKLDWAMQQVANSIKKLKKESEQETK